MTCREDPARDGDVDRVDRGRENLDHLTGRIGRFPDSGTAPTSRTSAARTTSPSRGTRRRRRASSRRRSRLVREEVRGGRAAVVRLDLAVERRALLEHRLHRREAGDRAAASVRTGPAEIAFTRMFLKPRSHAR
jgi:hypothetical protein